MECPNCKSSLSVKVAILLAFKGRATCPSCKAKLRLANRTFIVGLLVLLILFVIVSTYFLAANSLGMGLTSVWNYATFLMPEVIFILIFGILVLPAMEVKVES